MEDGVAVSELVRTLSSPDRSAAAEAAWSLYRLAADECGREAVSAADGLQALIMLLAPAPASSCDNACAAAAAALSRLAIEERNEDVIRSLGGIDALAVLLFDETASLEARTFAVGAIANLATDTNEPNQERVRSTGVIPVLVAIAAGNLAPNDMAGTSHRVTAQKKAALALRNLATNAANALIIDTEAALLNETAATAYRCVMGGSRLLSSEELPENWDVDVMFTHRILLESELCPQGSDDVAINSVLYAPEPTAGVQIRPIDSPGHPCHGQKGLYATASIAQGDYVIRYTGVATHRSTTSSASSLVEDGKSNSSSEDDEKPLAETPALGSSSDYVYTLCARGVAGGARIDIDALQAGNESRYINDFRGVPGDPGRNVQFIEERNTIGAVEIWIQAVRAIQPGDELLIYYNKSYAFD